MQHPKCCTKLNLTIFKFDPTSSNMLQQIATGWPNVRNMLSPTMLQDVALKCCGRLARPLNCQSQRIFMREFASLLKGFKIHNERVPLESEQRFSCERRALRY